MHSAPTVLLVRQPIMRAAAMLEVTAAHGIFPPSADELAEARELAERLMGHEVASLDTYRAVMAIQPASVLVFKEDGRVTGVTASLFLRRRAVDVIVRGRFNALTPDVDLLAREGEHPAAAYGWGVAVATRPASKAILGGGVAMKDVLFPTLTAFARAVTGAGRHICLTRYGYRPLRGPDDDLLVSEPQVQEQAA
jgi:hypothetical protein